MKNFTAIKSTLPAFALAIFGSAAVAQEEWRPEEPITMLIGFSVGGPVDIAGRELAQRMGDHLGQPVVVENLPGAGGEVAVQRLARARPDGHTIFFAAAGNVVINPLVLGDTTTVDSFVPVSMVSRTPHMLSINAKLPFQSVEDLIAYAKEHPGELNAGSAGTGAAAHLGLEMLKLYADVDITHVPYPGTAPSIVDLASGAIDMTFSSRPSLDAMLDAGHIRIIGATDKGPSNDDVPLIGDVVPNFGYTTWYGVMAPEGTEPAVVEALNASVRTSLGDQALVDRFLEQNATLEASSPEEMATYLAEDRVRWKKVIDAAGIGAP